MVGNPPSTTRKDSTRTTTIDLGDGTTWLVVLDSADL